MDGAASAANSRSHSQLPSRAQSPDRPDTCHALPSQPEHSATSSRNLTDGSALAAPATVSNRNRSNDRVLSTSAEHSSLPREPKLELLSSSGNPSAAANAVASSVEDQSATTPNAASSLALTVKAASLQHPVRSSDGPLLEASSHTHQQHMQPVTSTGVAEAAQLHKSSASSSTSSSGSWHQKQQPQMASSVLNEPRRLHNMHVNNHDLSSSVNSETSASAQRLHQAGDAHSPKQHSARSSVSRQAPPSPSRQGFTAGQKVGLTSSASQAAPLAPPVISMLTEQQHSPSQDSDRVPAPSVDSPPASQVSPSPIKGNLSAPITAKPSRSGSICSSGHRSSASTEHSIVTEASGDDVGPGMRKESNSSSQAAPGGRFAIDTVSRPPSLLTAEVLSLGTTVREPDDAAEAFNEAERATLQHLLESTAESAEQDSHHSTDPQGQLDTAAPPPAQSASIPDSLDQFSEVQRLDGNRQARHAASQELTAPCQHQSSRGAQVSNVSPSRDGNGQQTASSAHSATGSQSSVSQKHSLQRTHSQTSSAVGSSQGTQSSLAAGIAPSAAASPQVCGTPAIAPGPL